jgi:hypothetical protein
VVRCVKFCGGLRSASSGQGMCAVWWARCSGERASRRSAGEGRALTVLRAVAVCGHFSLRWWRGRGGGVAARVRKVGQARARAERARSGARAHSRQFFVSWQGMRAVGARISARGRGWGLAASATQSASRDAPPPELCGQTAGCCHPAGHLEHCNTDATRRTASLTVSLRSFAACPETSTQQLATASARMRCFIPRAMMALICRGRHF